MSGWSLNIKFLRLGLGPTRCEFIMESYMFGRFCNISLLHLPIFY